MGTTLTGTTPQDTYDSLIKVTDNGPLSATAKYLSDGLGNDSALALSTSKVGIGTATPVYNLHINAATDSRIIITDSAQGSTANDGIYIRQSGVNSSIVNQENGTLQFGTNNSFVQTILANGNVGIGTSAPTAPLDAVANSSANVLTLRTRSGSDDYSFVQFKNNAGTEVVSEFFGHRTGASTGRLGFSTNNGSNMLEHLSITSDGYVRLTTNSGGIQFNGDTSSNNALSDYEIGTWTMGVTFDGNAVGVTATSSLGTYTKIGRQVTVNGYLGLTSKGSSTGSAAMTGLPFTIANSASTYNAGSFRISNISFASQYQGFGDPNTTIVRLEEVNDSTGGVTPLTDADFANNANIMISLTYFV